MRAGQSTVASPASMAPAESFDAGAAERGDGKPGIVDLVAAGKPRQRQVEQPVLVLIDEPAALGERHVVGAVAGRAARPRAFASSSIMASACSSCGPIDAGRAALQDAGLLRGDAGEVLAEEIRVVVADRRRSPRRAAGR